MKYPTPETMRGVAARAALIYALVGALWIAGSDHVVSLLARDPETFARLSNYKGWAFVGVTAVLLYLALRRPLARWEAATSQRHEAVEALRQSEARFRMFAEQAVDAFYLHDAQGRLLDVNRHACTALGYTREELLGMKVWDVAPDVKPEDGLRRWSEAAPGMTQTLPSCHRRRDGSTYDVELRLGCFEVRGQRLFLALARDISERREAEAVAEATRRVLEMIACGAELHATLEQLARMMEECEPGMLCSILIVDEAGRHLRHGAAPSLPSAYAAAIDGAEIGPAAGSCGTAAFRRERVIVEDIANDPLWAMYRDLAVAHGLAACWSTPFFDEERRVLGTFAVYYREPRRPTGRELKLVDQATHTAAICVARHRAERALRQSEADLREAQDRLQSALEIGGIGTFVVDFVKNVTIWDEALTRVYGCRWRPEDGARADPFLAIVHPEDRARVRRDVARAVEQGETPQSEYRVIHPDGAQRWVATTARAEFGPDGRPTRLIGATVDITARKNAEENYRQAQKVEAIGQLAGGIAHDFNNILTVIQAGVSFLELEKGLATSTREFVGEIKSAATRAANLTRQLLTFSRRQAMQLQHVELNGIVTNMSRMLQRILGEHIHMELRLAPHDLQVFADPGMIEQIVLNLAVNARDAMSGGGRLTLSTATMELPQPVTVGETARQGAFARLEVVDTGVGIPGDVLPHIFDPFFTTKEAGKGTGLGLATVRGIVEQHGGWVEVSTRVGEGSCFQVMLPLIPAKAIEEARRGAAARGRSGSETVLLVEDETVVRALVRNLLTRSGYRVLDAASGPRAIELWNENGREVDLLISDLVMPDGMSGYELAEYLRRERPSLRVVFTSGYSPEMVRRDSPLGAGVAFLAKPFDLDDLTRTVRDVLDDRAGDDSTPLQLVDRR
ncbi:MAG: PAS domain S-box protein [Opitutaceae bacterium]|nr:PAS domain S-box protein [Opitutaceae bacterium]